MNQKNIFDLPTQQKKWANIKSQISKSEAKYTEEDEIDIVLQVKNKYTQVNYDYDDIPESLGELLEDFPETWVDLEFQLVENGTKILTQGFLVQFMEVEKDKQAPIEPSSFTHDSNFPQSEKKESPTNTPQPQIPSPSPYQLDINKLLQQNAETSEKATERIERMLEKFMNQNSHSPNNSSTQQDHVNAILLSQIQELKETNRELKTENSNLQRELSSAHLENARLSVLSTQAQNSSANVINPEAKLEEHIKNYERTQKRIQEQVEEKKKELDDLKEKIIENRVLATVKNSGKENNTEVDKAFADILRSKAPMVIDRGFDYLFPLNPINNANGTNQATLPAII